MSENLFVGKQIYVLMNFRIYKVGRFLCWIWILYQVILRFYEALQDKEKSFHWIKYLDIFNRFDYIVSDPDLSVKIIIKDITLTGHLNI